MASRPLLEIIGVATSVILHGTSPWHLSDSLCKPEETHYNLGRVYKVKGELTTAEKHLKRACEINPKYALAYAALGELLTKAYDFRREPKRGLIQSTSAIR